MSSIDWLKEQNSKAEDTLKDIERGVRYFRGAGGSASRQETTNQYKAELEDRIARNTELIAALEASDAHRT